MTRLGSLILCATLGTGILACGSNGNSSGGAGGTLGSGGTTGSGGAAGTGTSTKTALDLAPVGNTVSGWTVDTSLNKGGSAQPMTAPTEQAAVDLIDGAAAPFYKGTFTPKTFLWQNYVNTTLPAAPPTKDNPAGASLVLYILQMPSADQATGLYTALLQESEYAGQKGTTNDWQPTSPTLGTESRIENTVTRWWINFHQDVFYVEVMLSPSYGPPPDYTPDNTDLKNEALKFAQAIASKM